MFDKFGLSWTSSHLGSSVWRLRRTTLELKAPQWFVRSSPGIPRSFALGSVGPLASCGPRATIVRSCAYALTTSPSQVLCDSGSRWQQQSRLSWADLTDLELSTDGRWITW